jgi:integrase/recombinase XerD
MKTPSSIEQFRAFVELKDFRPATKKEYVRYLRKLSEHYDCDPVTLTEDQLRRYFLFLRQDKQLSGSAMTIAKAAFHCFFIQQLKKTDWKVFSELVIRRPQTLPIVLSRTEVARVLGALKEERFRICLRLIYHCGLRVSEAVAIEVSDIKDLRLHVRNGKGGKDRYVPLSSSMVQELRLWWKNHKHPVLLFPAPGRTWRERSQPLSEVMGKAAVPMSISAVQNAFRLARAETGIHPEATVHTLRHSYATHLLEEGISLRLISQYLGHVSLDTTVIYTHLTATSEEKVRLVLDALHRALPK